MGGVTCKVSGFFLSENWSWLVYEKFEGLLTQPFFSKVYFLKYFPIPTRA